MALARTDLGAFSRAGTSSPFVTSSFTPPDNSLLVVVISCEDCPTTFSADIAVSGGSLTWTKRLAVDNDADEGIAIFTAPVTTGASMTLSITGQGTNLSGLYARAFAYTGYNVGSPIGATATYSLASPGVGTATGLSITLSGAPATDSVVLAAIEVAADAGAGSAPGGSGGFTEIFDEELPATWQFNQVQVRTGSASTTVDWTHPMIQDYRRTAAALEIKAAAASVTARSYGMICG
jgi:hypothetical protein